MAPKLKEAVRTLTTTTRGHPHGFQSASSLVNLTTRKKDSAVKEASFDTQGLCQYRLHQPLLRVLHGPYLSPHVI